MVVVGKQMCAKNKQKAGGDVPCLLLCSLPVTLIIIITLPIIPPTVIVIIMAMLLLLVAAAVVDQKECGSGLVRLR